MLGLPKNTEFNKRIPKQKFYENLTIMPALNFLCAGTPRKAAVWHWSEERRIPKRQHRPSNGGGTVAKADRRIGGKDQEGKAAEKEI